MARRGQRIGQHALAERPRCVCRWRAGHWGHRVAAAGGHAASVLHEAWSPCRWCSRRWLFASSLACRWANFAGQQRPGAKAVAPRAGCHADHARLRLSGARCHAVWHWQCAGRGGHHRVCAAAAGSIDEPGHPPGAPRSDRGQPRVWRIAAANAAQGATAAGHAVHHGRYQPGADAVAVDGGDRLDDRGWAAWAKWWLRGIAASTWAWPPSAAWALCCCILLDRITQAMGQPSRGARHWWQTGLGMVTAHAGPGQRAAFPSACCGTSTLINTGDMH
ncbi:hypothetical protein FQA39_LY18677 [Lamprigera yunnana]|nr:hypothetical protein FQA39_LY18677 [Lamprigera yunnana]